ncbi:hypothetical protein [Desertivibrio insolitus]|uniref:hypothetical protein n=1 Tax=Herbiconiux sp. SYSU D00978 TaxID=2812562 RepID=UPI001A9592C8|nr:hypothetical protein [Herbiconiux sp. SYSU D00978]
MGNRVAVAALALCAVLASAGCALFDDPRLVDDSGQGGQGFADRFERERVELVLGPRPPDEPLTDEERERHRIAEADMRWMEVVASFPDAVRPQDPFEAYVPPGSDIMQVMYECFIASGIDAELHPGGGLSWATPSVDAAVSVWTCEARHPIEPFLELSERQRGYQYDYQVWMQAPCVRATGHDVPDAPSREEYLAAWPNVSWDPLYSGPMASSEYERVHDLCPPLTWH